MIQTGKNLTIKDDPLQKVNVDYLYNAIKKPKPEIEAKMRQLRAVKSIDKKQYSVLKKQLPYIVCGIFNPPFRRVENFGCISHFILDLDHLSEKATDPQSLKSKLSADEQIELMFVSPGGDGLKIMFSLSEKCYDHARFSLFYKVFARRFSSLYNLSQVIDPCTSDVTRACFISIDPEIYYNSDAVPVEISDLIDFNNTFETEETAKAIKEEEVLQSKDASRVENEIEKVGLAADVLAAIRKTLNPNTRLKPAKTIYVPEELHKMVDLVKERMDSLSVGVDEVIDIHYGKKFRFYLGLKKAEINLFYGKRGYTVVISPRAGTDKELNEVCSVVIGDLFKTEIPDFPGNSDNQ